MKSAEGMPLGENEVVLVVDEDSAMCDSARMSLENTDMDMPGNRGPSVHALRRFNPNTRSVMISETVGRWTEPKDSLIAVSVLEKLFAPTQLLQTLKNLLAQQQAINGR